MEREDLNDLRDRMARAEQNHLNLKENFGDFKQSTQEELKVLGAKLDQLMDAVTGIRMVIAKWLGAGGVIIFLAQIAIDKLLK